MALAIGGGIASTFQSAPLDYSEIRLYQVSGVMFYDGGGLEVTIGTIEEESTFSMKAITRPDDIGGQRIVAYDMQARIVFPNNDYDEYYLLFQKLASPVIADFDMYITMWNRRTGAAERNVDIAYDASITPNLSINCLGWEISSVEKRPRMSFTIRRLMTVGFHASDGSVRSVFQEF